MTAPLFSDWLHFHVRRIRTGRWEWSISDGYTGPTIVGPKRTLTERGARRQVARAAGRCERRTQARAGAR